MNKKNGINILFRFVPMGSSAPKPVPENEIWLDVGNRAAPGVLDHHSGDTGAWSAAQLVLENFQEFIISPLGKRNDATLILHQSPDLDAICSAWLVERILKTGGRPEPLAAVEMIVNAVSENDQGFIRTEKPECCWPIVMRTLISTECMGLNDETKVKRGMEALDQTFAILAEEGSLSEAAGKITTSSVKAVLAHAERDYLEDLSRAIFFQVRLPVRPWTRNLSMQDDRPKDPPDTMKERWSLADGVFLDDPRSALFKELARGDKKRSPMKQGFPLMVVSRDIDLSPDRPLQRHIISTDPLTGLHLQGLGKRLEALEQDKEDISNLPLLTGRERVKHGEGRHGYNVRSPWYDGRGHGFTIVDCPSVSVQGHDVTASCLSSAEALDALWEYGDPSRFMKALQAEAALIYPATLQPGWEAKWKGKITLSDICRQDFSEEVRQSGSFIDIRVLRETKPSPVDGIDLTEQQLWNMPDNTALWMGKFTFNSKFTTVRDISRAIYALQWGNIQSIVPEGVALSSPDDALHVINCRLRPTDISLEEKTGFSSQAMYRLAMADPPYFRCRADDDELASVKTVISRDHRNLVYPSIKGIAVISTRNVPFEEEKDFHRPECFHLLAALAFAQETALKQISRQFIKHRSERNPMKTGKLILTDREKLMRLEQELSFSRVTDRRFGQRSYDVIVEILGVQKLSKDTQEKIESLAEQVRDTRGDFYQKIAFLVSVLFAPLAITAGFFSGTHMEREFSKGHLTFFPASWQPAGWIQFFTVFFSLSMGLGFLWLIVKWGYSRKGPGQWFKRNK